VFPVGIGLRDPRSQKRDLGHPSVSPPILQRAQALLFLSDSLQRDVKKDVFSDSNRLPDKLAGRRRRADYQGEHHRRSLA
jgi:hypothetical protein